MLSPIERIGPFCRSLLQSQVLERCTEPDALCNSPPSRCGFGTCAKLCSIVSAMCCALHLLMNWNSNFYVLLQLRSVAKPSPFSRMRRKKSLVPKIPTALLEHTLSPKSLDVLATDYFLELIAVWKWPINGFWRALTFRGGKRCGTPRPLHPAPLPLSSSNDTDTSLSSSPPVCTWYSLACLGPPRAKHHVWLALDAYASRTPKPGQGDAAVT